MSQVPYPQQQYQPRPSRLFFPALSGAAPATAGKQIIAWLLDGVILGLPVTILSVLAFLPVFFTLFTNLRQDSYSVDQGWSQAQWRDFSGSLLLGLLLNVVLFLIYYLLYWYLIAVRGRTPGMSVLGLRLVSVETGRPIGWGPAFLRGLVVVLGSAITSGLLGLLFWLSPLFDSSSGWAQSWHDKMVKAVFIDTKVGRDTTVQ